ncbi:transcriptional regulator [Streptomyces venezuelae]|uniref:Transcriptional regulator n=2 Tax=Streptomyces venezuelae TaxID=54571 RepID=A0A5P2BWQ4_STRVZ|nr:transcriptional regulator [Streptomyces venezuelae]
MSRPRRRSHRNASAMRMVGALLALHRSAAGYTQSSLAERFGLSEEQIASVEQGRRALKLDLAVQLDALLGTNGTLETAVSNMPEIDLVPRWAEEYMDLEREALALSWYDNQVLPGLLQTSDYARGVFQNDVPALTEDEIELRVAARMERQEVLHRRAPPTVCFIISQVTLMDRLGGDDVYVAQLRHLLELTSLPGVTLQVMPVGRSFHAGLSGPFILIETPDHQRLGYTEAQRGSQLIADPDEVSILERKCAMLRTQALNPLETRDLLDRLLGEQ